MTDDNSAEQEDQTRVATALVRQARNRIAAALQRRLIYSVPKNSLAVPKGSMLTSWVVVAEFTDPDGEVWLSWLNDAGGTSTIRSPSAWVMDGLLRYAIRGDRGKRSA